MCGRAGASNILDWLVGDAVGATVGRTRDGGFLAALGFAAAGLIVSFFCYAFQLPQAPERMARSTAELIPRFDLWSTIVGWDLPAPATNGQVALAVVVLGVVSFALYGLAVCMCWNRAATPASLCAVLGATVVFFVLAALSLPTINSDVYNYVSASGVAAFHHSNPYAVAADAFPHDPIYQYAQHDYTSIPGDDKLAAWMLVSTGLTKLAGTDVVTSVLLYRFAFLAFNLANVALILVLLRRLRPHLQLAGVVGYAWNPIVVINGQTKVDTVMVFFLLVGTLALVTSRRRLAVVTLTLSAMTKLITLPLLAVCCLREAKLRRWREFAIHTGLVIATTAAVYAPYWKAPGLLSRELGLINQSASSVPDLLRFGLMACFAALILWMAGRQDGSDERLLRSWAIVALIFSAFVTHIAFSWFLLVLIAVTFITLQPPVVAVTIGLSFAGFVSNTWDNAGRGAFPLMGVHVPRALVYLVPAVAGAAAIVLRRRLVMSRRGARQAAPVQASTA